MANDRNRSPNSIFTNVAIAAPIITGVGVGARNLYRTMNSSAVQSNRHSGTFLKNFAAKIGGPSGASMFSGDLSIMNGTTPDMVHMAWEMALSQADPGKIIRRSPLDAVNPAASIEFFAKNQDSLLAGKVMQSFVRQLGGIKLHNTAVAFTGGEFSLAQFGRAKKHNFIRSNVSVMSFNEGRLRHTLANIETHIKGIPGAEMNMQMTSREGLDGAQLMLHLKGAHFGTGVAVEIPMEIYGTPGVIAHGVTQQTKRMVGQYKIVENNVVKSTLKHEEYVANRFYEEILLKQIHNTDMTPSHVRKIISDFNYSMVEDTEWVPNVPHGLIPALDAKMKLGGQRAVLIDGAYERLNTQQASQVMAVASNKLFPSTSGAQLAKGVVSTLDAQKLWFGGEAFPWARRPMQAHGRGFGPSAKAVAARLQSQARAMNSWMHTDVYKEYFSDASPMDIMAKTVYVSEKKHAAFAEAALGGTLGGTGLYSTMINNQLEHVEALSKNLTVNADMNKKLLPYIEGGAHFSMDEKERFYEGEILGYDKNRNPIHYTPDMKLTGGFSYTDRDVQFVHLQGTKTLPTEMHPKVFGSAKAVLQQMQQSEIDKLLQEKTGIRITGAEVVVGMDELKKNRALHNMQMLSALHDYTYKHMRQRNGGHLDLGAFNTSFRNKADAIMARAAEGAVYKQEGVMKDIYDWSREVGLGEHAIGRIFGALPDTVKVNKDKHTSWRDQIASHGLAFSDKEASAIEEGIVEGTGSYFYGGPSNAGGMGSVEPRFFELLQGKQFGSLGPRMSHDIAQRMIVANPEIVREQSVLNKALYSIAAPFKLAKDDKVHSLKNLTPYDMDELLTHGGVLDTEGMVDKATHIVIPGTDSSMMMREYVTPEGLSTHSLLHYAYRDFLEQGSMAANGKASRAAANASFKDLISELGSAREATITGKHTGLARGKVMGSRYLKAISGTAEELGDDFTVGISHEHGEAMFEEMEKLHRPTVIGGKVLHEGNPAELAAIQEQKKRFLSGESVGAIVRRDPEIGPYSAMPMKFKKLDRLKGTDDIIIPQSTHSIADLNGKEISKVSFGAMPGFAGDFDGDNVHIMLGSSGIEKDLHGHYASNGGKYTKNYEDYIIRQQLLKAKAPAARDLTKVVEMGADAEKLAIAKTHVGPLSVPMRELRAAISEYNGQHSEKSYYDAMSVLEALEQTPIAGKHVPADRIEEFTMQMSRLASAGKAGRGHEMRSILEDTLKYNEDAPSIFKGGKRILVDGKERSLKGLDLDDVANTFKKAYSHYRSITSDMPEGISRAIANDSMGMTFDKIIPQLSNKGGLLADFKLGVEASPMREIVRQAMGVRNKVAAISGNVLQHMGKPLAIGFGAALGIAAILSKPISTISPSQEQPRVKSANTTTVPPDNIHPDPEVTGEPSIPNTMPGPSARYRPDDQGARVNIRGINRSGANMSAISSAITQRLNGNTNVNVNIRDRKTSLTPQKIDSIMRR